MTVCSVGETRKQELGTAPSRVSRSPSYLPLIQLRGSDRGLFAQLEMLAQLDDDCFSHDLAAMNLRGLAPVDRGVPARLRVAMNGHLEITGADPLLHDLFQFGGGLFLLIHAEGGGR